MNPSTKEYNFLPSVSSKPNGLTKPSSIVNSWNPFGFQLPTNVNPGQVGDDYLVLNRQIWNIDSTTALLPCQFNTISVKDVPNPQRNSNASTRDNSKASIIYYGDRNQNTFRFPPPFVPPQFKKPPKQNPFVSYNNNNFTAPKFSCRQNGFCSFCWEHKEPFFNHLLKDSNDIVVCPVLRRYVCKHCGQTGDNAHTEFHCPHNKAKKSGIPIARKLKMTPHDSSGRRRNKSSH